MAKTIKEVSKEDLYDYFRHISEGGVDCGWSQAQAQLIADSMMNVDSWQAVIDKLIRSSPKLGATSTIASAIVMGFQCGREFENRLMAKAIREGK